MYIVYIVESPAKVFQDLLRQHEKYRYTAIPHLERKIREHGVQKFHLATSASQWMGRVNKQGQETPYLFAVFCLL